MKVFWTCAVMFALFVVALVAIWAFSYGGPSAAHAAPVAWWGDRGAGLVGGIGGVISFIFGVVALTKGQPYAVYYPALLTGIVLPLVIGLNLRTIEARYREIELQKMRVQDATDEGRGMG